MGTKEILRKLYPLFLLLAVGLLATLYGYSRVRLSYGNRVYPNSTESFSDAMKDGDVTEIPFTASRGMTISGVSLLFVDYGNVNTDGTLLITVTDRTTGMLLGGGSLAVSDLAEWIWAKVDFPGQFVNQGDQIVVTVTASGLSEDTVLSFVMSKNGEHPALGIETDAWDSLQKLQLIFSFLTLTLIAVAYVLIYLRPVKLETLFLLVFPVLGLMFNLLIPAKLGPDESAHLNSVYKIAERLSGWESSAGDRSVITEEELNNGLTVEETGHDYYVTYYGWLSSRTGEQTLTEQGFWGSQENPDLTYTPAAIGIVLGRDLRLSAAGIITMGRVFAFLPVWLLLFYAIKRIPFGKAMLFTIAMLPTMVQEATTINADGIDIALSFALIAAVCRLIYGERDRLRFLDYGMTILTVLLLCRCKYGALVPLCLLPFALFWKKRTTLRTRENREEWIVALAALLLPLACVVIGFFPLIHTTVHAYGETLWSTHYTFSDILHDPTGILFLLGSTLYYKLDFYIFSLAGTYLGWLNIVLPQYLTVTMLALVLFSALPKRSELERFSGKARAFFGIVALLGIGFAVGGMLIGWTDVGADFIDGVQGRYFLPFLPLLLFALQPRKVAVPEDGSVQKKAVMASIFMQIFILTALFVRTS